MSMFTAILLLFGAAVTAVGMVLLVGGAIATAAIDRDSDEGAA